MKRGMGSSRPLHVLVAEDDRVSQRLVVGLLERLGHTAEVAMTGSEAVNAVARARFDLALMDLEIPVLDGLAATAAIRRYEAHSPGRHLPIVALTGADYEGVRARCLDAGMDRCLVKPIAPQELVALLEWARQPEDVRPSDVPPAIDPVMVDGYAADPSFFGMLVDEFLAEGPRRLAALRTAYASGDVAALKFEAHAFKGGARVFGARLLADHCAALEDTHAIDDDTREHWEQLEAEFARVRQALATARQDTPR